MKELSEYHSSFSPSLVPSSFSLSLPTLLFSPSSSFILVFQTYIFCSCSLSQPLRRGLPFTSFFAYRLSPPPPSHPSLPQTPFVGGEGGGAGGHRAAAARRPHIAQIIYKFSGISTTSRAEMCRCLCTWTSAVCDPIGAVQARVESLQVAVIESVVLVSIDMMTSCIGSSLWLSTACATTPGPNYDLMWNQ